jgi:cytosine/adenosine deaminase-related metal-dependent hydrolase
MDELTKLSTNGHTVIHCPISNRLLGNVALNLSALAAQKTPFVLGTDGLSSNYSLDLFEEMKIALFTHHSHDLITLAKALWESVTCVPAHALRLNCGTIAPNYDADLLVVQVDYPINDQLPIHLITQPKSIDVVYIQGEKVL